MTAKNSSFTKAHFVAFLITGALIAWVLMQAMPYVQQHKWVRTTELWAYEFLQSWVPPYEEPEKPLSVVVVDIGKMPGGKGDENTSRTALIELLETVIVKSPQAIAVDIDFSPDNGWYRTNEDPKLFNFCLEQRTKVPSTPIFLGIYENTAVPPNAWLAVPQYKELAVSIAVPPVDTRRIPLWFRLDGWNESLPSLSAALANVRGRAPSNVPGWLQVAVDTSPRQTDRGYAYADTLVDYTKLEQLQKETVEYITAPGGKPVLSKAETLKDKLVIVGDVSQPLDTFEHVPGHEGEKTPGVYLHANAVHTLTSHPIFELTSKARHKVEIVVSAFIILCAAFIRRRYIPEVAMRYQKYLTASCIALFVVAVIVLVRYYNVFWFDFHLVIIALFLHLKLESVAKPFEHFLHNLQQKAVNAFRNLLRKWKLIGKVSSNPAKKKITNSTSGNRL